MQNHTEFILSPITGILKTIVSASAGIGSGIETYPLCDYVMQSVFLKMTGFQEQKMKCICWDLATNDYGYRYDRYTKRPLGECSSYDEKKVVYKDLIDQIKRHNHKFEVLNEIDKETVLLETHSEIENIFFRTNLSIWAQNNFNEFVNNSTIIQLGHFIVYVDEKKSNETKLFENNLKDIYEKFLYKHRNRCAHNTLSYQQNLPTLKTLVNEDYKYENYFIYFAILVLIDKVFIALYSKYLLTLEDNTH